MINWNLVTRQEIYLIDKITSRACREFEIEDRMNLTMDITATHISGMPLDLEKFLGFDRFNFAHDIYGIMEHIDRNNGQLQHGFLPRCAQ